MWTKPWSAAALSIALIATANAGVGPLIDSHKISTAKEEELSYFPSGLYLKQIACGYRNIMADMLWLRSIQYYGKHRQTDLVFHKAAHVFETLTDLDPGFVEAYRFGSLVLVEDAGDQAGGIELLQKGVRNNPRESSLYFDLGFHTYMSHQFDLAAAYFERASRLPGANIKAARFAAYAESRRGALDVAEEMWLEIAETTTNKNTKASAEFALKGIAARRDTIFLAERARAFKDQYGRFPAALEEMVSGGVIRFIPDDPFGTRYVVNAKSGEVRSWYLLAREMKRDMSIIENGSSRFRDERGFYPSSPDELVRLGYLDAVPAPFGAVYKIDQSTGVVEPRIGSHGGRD